MDVDVDEIDKEDRDDGAVRRNAAVIAPLGLCTPTVLHDPRDTIRNIICDGCVSSSWENGRNQSPSLLSCRT